LLGRFGEIAAGLVLLLIGVLAFTVFQLQGSDPGDDRRQAGARVGVTLAGEIAFARDRDGDGRGELTLINADGSDYWPLPSTIEGDSSLAWSPTGDRFAFAGVRSEGSPSQVYVGHLDGGNSYEVSQVPQGASEPVWSPDGQRIAFSRFAEPVPVSDSVRTEASGPGTPPGITGIAYSRIYLVNADGSDLRTVSDPATQGDIAPSWSPDGRRLAFVRNEDGYSSQIWVMDADGANQHQVSHYLRLAQHPLWSPDGKWIAFIGFADAYPVTYLVSPDGSDQHRLLSLGVSGGKPTWSPDGRRLAYLGSSAFVVVNADGLGEHRLADVTGHYFSPPAWSPDGKWIAFTSQPHRREVSGPWVLNVVAVDGESPTVRTIAKDVLQDSRPLWRPVLESAPPG
jgi:Tol biopolymer transport system component